MRWFEGAVACVATAALVKIAWSGVGGVAQAAEPGAVACEVFPLFIGPAVTFDKAARKWREGAAEPVRVWAQAHPGPTVVATTIAADTMLLVCVREG
ncbi:MAG: hypothetical protein ABMA64_17785 [Myxococcota bacterium]